MAENAPPNLAGAHGRAPEPSAADLALAREVARAAAARGGRAYLVGGCVRDSLRGMPRKDLDVEVFRVAPAALEELLGTIGRVDAVGKAFGIFKLTRNGTTIDVGLPRRERAVGHGHRDFSITSDPELDVRTAASRRDLTINAILEDLLTGEIVDPWNGRADLYRGVLRHVSDAFAEDPLRVLRVVQFAARFEFAIAEETAALCRSIDLRALPRERIADEIAKWLTLSRRPSLGLAAFVATGAHGLVPELRLDDPRYADATLARGRRLDAAAARLATLDDPIAFMLAALFAPLPTDAAPAEAGAIATRVESWSLGLDRARLATALAVALEEARRLCDVDDSPTLRRLALRAPLHPLCLLLEAEGEMLGVPRTQLRTRAAAIGVLDAPPSPWLLGRDLLALGAPPGKALGALLAEAFDRQLDGELADRDAALEFARQRLSRPPS